LVERVTGVVAPGRQLRPRDHAARPALQSGRTLEQRAQDTVADRDVVRHHVELRKSALRKVQLVRVADAYRVPRDLHLGRGRLCGHGATLPRTATPGRTGRGACSPTGCAA